MNHHSNSNLQIRDNIHQEGADSSKMNEIMNHNNSDVFIPIQKRIMRDFSPLNPIMSSGRMNEYNSDQINEKNRNNSKIVTYKENLFFSPQNDILSRYDSNLNIANRKLQEIQKSINSNNRIKEGKPMIKVNYITKQHRFPHDDFEILKRKVTNFRRNLNPQDELQALKNSVLKLSDFKTRNQKVTKDSEECRGFKEALQFRILVSLDMVIIFFLFFNSISLVKERKTQTTSSDRRKLSIIVLLRYPFK